MYSVRNVNSAGNTAIVKRCNGGAMTEGQWLAWRYLYG